MQTQNIENKSMLIFRPEVRKEIFHSIKTLGIKRTEKMLRHRGYEPEYAKAIIRSIMRKEGW